MVRLVCRVTKFSEIRGFWKVVGCVYRYSNIDFFSNDRFDKEWHRGIRGEIEALYVQVCCIN